MNKIYKAFDEAMKEDVDILKTLKGFKLLKDEDKDKFEEELDKHNKKTDYAIINKYGKYVICSSKPKIEPDCESKFALHTKEELKIAEAYNTYREECKKNAKS